MMKKARRSGIRSGALFLSVLVSLCVLGASPFAHAGELERHFGDRPGTIAIYDTASGQLHVARPERAARRFSPCSTFKIPNSLIALTAGAVTLEDSRIAWNPERDPRQEHWPDSWARDQDLTRALRNSVLWYYQELARRVGLDEMTRQLERIGYGNADTSDGIDRFWLESSLGISALEQIDFLRRFHAGELGFDPRYTEAVKAALVLERDEGFVLGGKTGTCQLDDGRYLGWLVGWVERGSDVAFYALQLEDTSFRALWHERRRVAKAALADLGYMATSE